MFSAWGRLVYRHRRLVALTAVVLAGASAALAGQAANVLSSGGWQVAGSESAQVTDRLAREFGAGRSNLIVLYRAEGADATTREVQQRIARSLAVLREDERVDGVFGYAESNGDARFVSKDRQLTYVLVQLRATDEASIDQVDDLRALIAPQPGLTFQVTGYGPLALDANVQSEEDLQRAEMVSLPLALLILVAVFASILAAGLPLLVAALAIPTTLALVYLVGQQIEMTIYVINVATMLGLALAIDYSLFLVSRFREELSRGRPVGDAVEVAVATAGKAVTFSGIAVAIGLLGLLFFTSPAISSIGIGGSLVVLCSVLYALTFLPAVLGMLGHRVNALSVGGAFGRLRRTLGLAPAESVARNNRWERVARWVMRHPAAVLVPTLIVLLAAGTPFLRLNQAVPDAAVLPAGLESRDAYVALREEFESSTTSPFTILVDVRGDPLSAANIEALVDYADAVLRLEDVSAVESPFRHPVLVDPRTGKPLDASTVAAFYAAPDTALPAAYVEARQALLERYVRGSTVRLDALSPAEPGREASLALTERLRALDPGEGITVQVGGVSPAAYDTLGSMRQRTPWAVAMTLLVSAIVLFLLFGSLVLPIKAVFMTLLSITASFGALVWIFQEGNLHELLDFEPLGYTIAGNPVIMFAVIFGLSMDYEVLLLSRIQEAYRRTGDNTASVAEGLARTAAVITGAALIMVTVFAAFALADIVTIKSIGVGMAIAVLLDATIIRVLLVPATMRLMGRWNWWAPGPLGRLADRLGFSHVESEDGRPAAPEPTTTAAAAG
ncbi:MAG TPA: MMPL family transporter [Candidatus Caenarcaniphilales bacterium]|nr:MMPL family transporter [Candidatus Caenarcaniphilales bacterium]